MTERRSEKMYEKITVNLPVVDLGKIDYFAEQGFYNSRAEFIRIAIKNELTKNDNEIDIEAKRLREDKKEKQFVTIGVASISKSYLEGLLKEGRKVNVFVVGRLNFKKDIDLDLIKKTVSSFRVYGIKRGPEEIIKYCENLSS